jgi:hypothetical protein
LFPSYPGFPYSNLTESYAHNYTFWMMMTAA